MKRAISLLICVILSVTLFPASAFSYCETIELRYDDRYDVSEKTALITNAGKPTSFQCGTDIPDTAVIAQSGDSLIAVGIGTAEVELDGKSYRVNVSPAPISLFMIFGQSNAEGYFGERRYSVENEDGQVYSSYGPHKYLGVTNAYTYIPLSLTEAPASVRAGESAVNALTASGSGKKGFDSALAYRWTELTGEKLWIINAAHSDTRIDTWIPGATEYRKAAAFTGAAEATLKNEIAAGHYTFSHLGYFWLQGECERYKTADYYLERFTQMHEGFEEDLAFDFDGDGIKECLEFCGIIIVRATDKDNRLYTDIAMNGPRTAQYFMAASSEEPFDNVYVVSNVCDSLVIDPDGNDPVKAYFTSKYGEHISYPVQSSGEIPMPSSAGSPLMYDEWLHYKQAAHNEIGFECAENAYYLLYPQAEGRTCTANVRVLLDDGFTVVGDTVCEGQVKLVPVVSPLYLSKELSVSSSASVGDDTWIYDFSDGDVFTASVKGGNSVTATCRRSASD